MLMMIMMMMMMMVMRMMMMMMMMMICVLTLPVCFTRPHGMFLVLLRVTNHMGATPPFAERNWHIYMVPSSGRLPPPPPPMVWSR